MRLIRYVALLLCLFCSHQVFPQAAPAWGGGADERDFSFGFTFSYVGSYFKIDKNPDWRAPYFDAVNGQLTDSLMSIGSAPGQGFAVGFLARHRITDHLEVRVTPGLIFADRGLNYTYANPDQNRLKSIRTTTIDIPALMKLKSDRIGNLRAYLLGGLKYSQSLGSKGDGDATAAPLEKAIKNVNGYASYEVGLGFDIYFEFFKMSPEVKIANSFGDVLVHDNGPFTRPINKLGLHTVMFSLHFE